MTGERHKAVVAAEMSERAVVISFDGGPLDGQGGFSRDCRPFQFTSGTYRFAYWGGDGDAIYEWGPTHYCDHSEGGE